MPSTPTTNPALNNIVNPKINLPETQGKFLSGKLFSDISKAAQSASESTDKFFADANKKWESFGDKILGTNNSAIRQVREDLDFTTKELGVVGKFTSNYYQQLEDIKDLSDKKGELTEEELRRQEDVKSNILEQIDYLEKKNKKLTPEQQLLKDSLKSKKNIRDLEEKEIEAYHRLTIEMKDGERVLSKTQEKLQKENEAIEKATKNTVSWKDKLREVNNVFQDITGLSLGQGGIAGMIMAATKMVIELDTKVSQLSRTYRGISGGALQGAVRGISADARIGVDSILDSMKTLAEGGANFFKDTAGASKYFVSVMRPMTIDLGMATEDVNAIMKNINQVSGSLGEATDLMVQFKNESAFAMEKYKITADGAASSLKMITKYVNQLGPEFTKVDKLGNRALDQTKIMRFTDATMRLAGKFTQVGLGAEKANEIIGKLLDVDRIEENVFAYSQLGVKIEDVMTGNAEGVANSVNKNMDSIVKMANSMPVYARTQYLKQFGGILDKETISALSKPGANLADITKIQKDKERETNAKIAADKMNAETQQSIGQAVHDLKPMYEDLMSLLAPSMDLLRPAIKLLGNLIKLLTGFLSANQKLIQPIIAGFLMFTALKFLLGGKGIPVHDTSNSSGGGGGVMKTVGLGVLAGGGILAASAIIKSNEMKKVAKEDMDNLTNTSQKGNSASLLKQFESIAKKSGQMGSFERSQYLKQFDKILDKDQMKALQNRSDAVRKEESGKQKELQIKLNVENKRKLDENKKVMSQMHEVLSKQLNVQTITAKWTEMGVSAKNRDNFINAVNDFKGDVLKNKTDHSGPVPVAVT